MDWGDPGFIIVIVTVCTGGWLINNWIRARHGYPLEDEWGGKSAKLDDKAAAELQRENSALRLRLDALESRAAALETIVTDGGFEVARQIEGLRASRNEVTTQ